MLLCLAMFIRVRLKEICFGNICFSNSFKIELMHAHLFIIKPEVAGMITITHQISS